MARIESDMTATLLDVRESAELERSWANGPGLWGWLTSVDHKSIGKRYIVTAVIFFLLGGVEAAAMRMQLARAENEMISPQRYNELFTMHGTTMMFLFGVPSVLGLGLYLVPLLVGTRNVAFPRLNAFGYWTYLVGGLFLYGSDILGSAPDTGWFSYVPLSTSMFDPGKRADVWAQTVTFTEIAALVAAVEIIVTVLKQRAPGMSLNRIPVYVWALLVTSFAVVFAMPAIALASQMLAWDRLVGTRFFDQTLGGDPLLWQHLFWFFGHPEVYIMFIPSAGVASHLIPVFARRKMFGHTAVVLSLVAVGFLSFGLWVHHMFATGLPQLAQSFFTAASLMIVIPNGVQIFCWIATLWAGRPRFDTPLLFILGFIVLFVVGGITGVMVASVPFDLQVHDTYFVVAHLHYVQVGAFVFPLFAALYFWFPKITGRMLSETLGKWHFWLFFIGMNLTFFPMHFLGLRGMTRRVYTYLPESGFQTLSQVATAGAVIMFVAMVIFLINVAGSLRSGVPAGDDPWGAHSLEWATSSPPAASDFPHIPVVRGLYPLWDEPAERRVVVGMRPDRREVLVTSVADAEPESRHEHPGPTIAPLLTALVVGVYFIPGIFTPWSFVAGTVLLYPTLLLWVRSKTREPHERTFSEELIP